jgi:hypothetical protein
LDCSYLSEVIVAEEYEEVKMDINLLLLIGGVMLALLLFADRSASQPTQIIYIVQEPATEGPGCLLPLSLGALLMLAFWLLLS